MSDIRSRVVESPYANQGPGVTTLISTLRLAALPRRGVGCAGNGRAITLRHDLLIGDALEHEIVANGISLQSGETQCLRWPSRELSVWAETSTVVDGSAIRMAAIESSAT